MWLPAQLHPPGVLEMARRQDESQTEQNAEAPEHLSARFELPDWVDEEIFHDFLSASKILLEELEGEILAYAEGDESALRRFRGRLHGLKGEAGVLGLDELASVCHALEDRIELPAGTQDRTDQLLRAKDWFAQAFESYAAGRVPDTRAPGIADLLAEVRREEPPAHGADEADREEASTDEDFHFADEGEVAVETHSAKETAAKEKPLAVGAASESASQSGIQLWSEDMLDVVEEFLQESGDGLTLVDGILLTIDKGKSDLEKVNALFRVFHSIKGVAGFLEVDSITQLAHVTETLLNCVREGTHELQGSSLDLVFDATGLMRELVEALKESVEQRTHLQPPATVYQLVQRLDDAVHGRESAAAPSEVTPVQAASAAPQPVPMVAQAQATRQSASTGKKLKETVKIDLERVDSLVEMIGELVIVESMMVHSPEIASLSSPNIRDYFSQFAKITRDLQDIGMLMRMVPVRSVFQKMARMVRDLSRKRGKKIHALLSGEGTEIDRSMVEHIADPLVHMIRNAVDHGLEEVQERQDAGKSSDGEIKLSAYHQGGSIVIEVADDGRGLNRDVILKKALERGVVKAGDTLTDSEIYNLIFAPGFSTAEKVTELSGRGVGMDVVRRNIESLRGRVTISSEPGKGCVFKMILPLTLAIIDGMVVSCGSEQYILPTLSIIESLRPDAAMIYSVVGRGALITIRDETLPLLRLDQLFDIGDAIAEPTHAQIVVVETTTGKIGLLVDEVIAQQQVVIKSLGTDLSNSRLLSGAAILSNGHVGLIVNVDELSALAAELPSSESVLAQPTDTQPLESIQPDISLPSTQGDKNGIANTTAI